VSAALWLLIRLQLGGWFRYLGRNVRTLKGALLALVGLAVFISWVFSLLFLPGTRDAGAFEPATLRRTGPALLVLYCVLNVVFSSSEKAIYFSPAEINFLFSGPFSRRSLLVYKIVQTLLVGLPSAVIMTLVLRVRDTWFLASFLGLVLIFVFLQLFSIVLALLASSLGARLYSRGRQLAVVVVCVLAALILIQSGLVRHFLPSPTTHQPSPPQGIGALAAALSRTPLWQTISLPLVPFVETILARQLWPDLVVFFLLAAGVNLALMGVIVLLDADYLEASAVASARLYARLQQARGRNVSVEDSPRRKRQTLDWSRLSVPMLPYLGGVGPLVWRQLTTALRGMGRLMTILMILTFVMVIPMISSLTGEIGDHKEGARDQETLLVWSLLGAGIWFTVFFTTLVPYDFRGDVDRLAVLKTLPIPSWRIALAQLIVPTLLLSILQEIALLALLFTFPGQDELLLSSMVLAPAATFLLLALENLLFSFPSG
jgi:hypothetical protein